MSDAADRDVDSAAVTAATTLTVYRLVAETIEVSEYGDQHTVGYYDTRLLSAPSAPDDPEVAWLDTTSPEARESAHGRIRFRRAAIAVDYTATPRFVKIDGSRTHETHFSFADRDTVWATRPEHAHARSLDGHPLTGPGRRPCPAGWPLADLREHAKGTRTPPRLRPHGATGYVEVYDRTGAR